MIQRDNSENKSVGPTVPYSKLYSLASPKEKAILYIGWIAAFITGLGMPSFVFLMGDVMNSFDPHNTTP